jgi:hypothetical protein
MNLQIETVTLKDGSRMDVVRDIEAVRRLVRICEQVHDRILRGEDDVTLLRTLMEGWQGPNAEVCRGSESKPPLARPEGSVCPHCGHTRPALLHQLDDTWRIWCRKCGAEGPPRKTKKGCIKAWMRRSPNEKGQR